MKRLVFLIFFTQFEKLWTFLKKHTAPKVEKPRFIMRVTSVDSLQPYWWFNAQIKVFDSDKFRQIQKITKMTTNPCECFSVIKWENTDTTTQDLFPVLTFFWCVVWINTFKFGKGAPERGDKNNRTSQTIKKTQKGMKAILDVV